MTPGEKATAKRWNEQIKAAASFLYNAALAFFAAGIGLWYGGSKETYWILAGALAGLLSVGFAIAILQDLRPEE